MLPPPCASCGAPLPLSPSDANRPDLCPTCARAARSPLVATPSAVPPSTGGPQAPTGSWGQSYAAPGNTWGQAPGTQRQRPVRARPVDALLTGLAAAAIGGAIWWAVTALTSRQFTYLALVVGLLVGKGVLVGARRGGVVQGVAAAVLCLAALAVAEYFIQRSLAFHQAHERGVSIDLPLWQGFGFAREVVVEGVKDHALTGLFWALAAVVAFISAVGSSRRSALG